MIRSARRTVVAALTAALVVGSPLIAPSATAATATAQLAHAPQPRTAQAVRTAAAAAFDDYAAGDYGLFWDRWSAASKRVVSRRDYVRRFKLCPQAVEGLRIKVEKVTLNSARTRARVRASRLDFLFNYDFVYEAGAWRYVLPADVARVYRKPVDQIVKEERAAGECG
ncbi:hypothetical protein ACFYY8_31695 [Streptosporangium sp. NPDC001559]|uniref:hypothetical protein n=1 Tax=Streptosporangium sp. NPDC001559 TaxID=3366187 RepID=UPI0036E90A9D